MSSEPIYGGFVRPSIEDIEEMKKLLNGPVLKNLLNETVDEASVTEKRVLPEEVNEMKKILTVVHDFNAVLEKKKIEELPVAVPEAEGIDNTLKALNRYVDDLLNTLNADLKTVIGELTNEVVRFSYSMKSQHTAATNGKNEFKIRAETAEQRVQEMGDRIAALAAENQRLKDSEEMRTRLAELERQVAALTKPV